MFCNHDREPIGRIGTQQEVHRCRKCGKYQIINYETMSESRWSEDLGDMEKYLKRF